MLFVFQLHTMSFELVLYVYFDLMVNKSGLTFYDVRIVHVGVAQYRAGVLPVFYGCIGLLCDLNDICLPAISFSSCLTVDQIFLLFVVWSLSSISCCMTHFKVLVFNAASSKLLLLQSSASSKLYRSWPLTWNTLLLHFMQSLSSYWPICAAC